MIPSETEVTIPDASIVAMPASAVDHDPPLTELLRVADAPKHTTTVPAMVAGAGLTVSVFVALLLHPEEVVAITV